MKIEILSTLKHAMTKTGLSGREILKIDTLIGKRTTIEGDLTAVGNLKFDGKIEGPVKVTGDLIIGEDAVIDGDVSANNIIIAGKVNGNITARGQLAVKQTAMVHGNHTSYSLVVDEGSVFLGDCNISEREAEQIPTEDVEEEKDERAAENQN